MKTKLLLTALLFPTLRSGSSIRSTFVFCLLSFVFFNLSSQVPQGFNYQAIARDGSGNPIISATMQVKIGILSDTIANTMVWEELFNPVKTNAFGMFGIVIGTGVKQSGSAASFSAIDWTKTPLFLRTSIYYPSSWKIMGTTKLQSVPYSMVASNLEGTVPQLSVKGNTATMDSALFVVRNNTGQIVFAVYNEGVRIYVDDGAAKGSTKGGFAIGGFGTAKGPSQPFFMVNADSIRGYIAPNIGKGVKGGFAIGGFDPSKTAIGEEYLRVTRDSTRIYIKESSKGVKGGFAIGGFNPAKGNVTDFTSLTPDNYFIGHRSGAGNTTGLYNSFLGYETGLNNTTGSNNALFGFQAGYNNSSGSSNLFLGYQSGYSNIAGSFNSFMGYKAGNYNSTGDKNSFMGSYAGLNNTDGGNNTFLGFNAGYSNLHGNANNFLGTGSGYSNSDGNNNVFIGPESGYKNISGNYNTFLGYRAGYSNLSSYNVFLGFESGYANTAGTPNVFIGYQAGRSNTTGTNNIFLGDQAGFTNSIGYDNVFIGNQAGNKSIDAYNNVCIGNLSGNEIDHGFRNVFIGYYSGRKTTSGEANVFIGTAAGELNTTGYTNILIGAYAGQNSNALQNIMLGHFAGTNTTTGSYNLFFGASAGLNNITGAANIYIGTQAGQNSTGSSNIFIGHYAGMNELGSNKLYIDNSSLSTPLIYGDFSTDYLKVNGNFETSGYAVISGTWVDGQRLEINSAGTGNRYAYIDFHCDDTYTDYGFRILRDNTGPNAPTTIFHRGTGAFTLLTIEPAPIIFETGSSERMRVEPNGNVGINTSAPGQKLDIAGGNGRVQTGYNWLTNSDIRYKKNIYSLEGCLAKVMAMRGVSFDLKNDSLNIGTGKKNIGFIAQELENVVPEVVITGSDGYKAVAYDKITAVLTEAVKEQQKQIEGQLQQIESARQENQQLKSQVQLLQEKVDQIEALLAKSGVK